MRHATGRNILKGTIATLTGFLAGIGTAALWTYMG